MKAALITEVGTNPHYADFHDPIVQKEDDVLVTVTAAALSHVTRSRASGTHYSSQGQIPFVVGMDGVGRRSDGQRVYFLLPAAPFGSMAEKTVVSRSHCIPLPDDISDVVAAAIAIPGMSSWAALTERARLLPGETVLINGATGTSGRLAVQIAKHLGAKKVIATGRNTRVLQSLMALGADVTITLALDGGALEQACTQHFAEGIDVVLDYLWGPSAEQLLITAAKAGADARPIRFVQIGSISANTITLPSAVLRSSALELMGSGIGSIPFERMTTIVAELFAATGPNGFEIATEMIPLSNIAEAWDYDESAKRIVFVPAAPDHSQYFAG